jgi:hypothetical protein
MPDATRYAPRLLPPPSNWLAPRGLIASPSRSATAFASKLFVATRDDSPPSLFTADGVVYVRNSLAVGYVVNPIGVNGLYGSHGDATSTLRAW